MLKAYALNVMEDETPEPAQDNNGLLRTQISVARPMAIGWFLDIARTAEGG